MHNFNFYKATETYKEKYFQLPKIFFTSDLYKNMSNDAKIAYTLLKERFDYSIQNNWIDEDGNIFFIFTVSELMTLLNCHEGKISKIKKELTDNGLLFQKRQAPKIINGKKEGQPNRLYLGKPEITSKDVYTLAQADSSQIAKIAIQENHQYNNDFSQIAKIAIQEKHNGDKASSQIAKIANNLEYTSLDTNRHLKDTDTDDLQNQLLLDGFVELMTDTSINTFVPERCLNLIAKFSETFEAAQLTVKTIHNAKHKAEQETGNTIVYEIAQEKWDIDTKLYTTLLKAYQKQKTENVNNIQNLIFIYVKNLFVEQVEPSINRKKGSLPSVSVTNWLE